MNALVLVDLQEGFNRQEFKKAIDQTIELCNHIDREKWVVLTACLENPTKNLEKMLDGQDFTREYEKKVIRKVEKAAKPEMNFYHRTYSVFNRRLVKYLREKNLNVVALTGTNSDSFVLHSAMDGFDLGFQVMVVKDCSASFKGDNFHQWAMEALRNNIGRKNVVSSSELFLMDFIKNNKEEKK
jgi:nicotinamidase-related amidase